MHFNAPDKNDKSTKGLLSLSLSISIYLSLFIHVYFINILDLCAERVQVPHQMIYKQINTQKTKQKLKCSRKHDVVAIVFKLTKSPWGRPILLNIDDSNKNADWI